MPLDTATTYFLPAAPGAVPSVVAIVDQVQQRSVSFSSCSSRRRFLLRRRCSDEELMRMFASFTSFAPSNGLDDDFLDAFCLSRRESLTN